MQGSHKLLLLDIISLLLPPTLLCHGFYRCLLLLLLTCIQSIAVLKR